MEGYLGLRPRNRFNQGGCPCADSRHAARRRICASATWSAIHARCGGGSVAIRRWDMICADKTNPMLDETVGYVCTASAFLQVNSPRIMPDQPPSCRTIDLFNNAL